MFELLKRRFPIGGEMLQNIVCRSRWLSVREKYRDTVELVAFDSAKKLGEMDRVSIEKTVMKLGSYVRGALVAILYQFKLVGSECADTCDTEAKVRALKSPESVTMDELRKSVRNIWKVEIDSSFSLVECAVSFSEHEQALNESVVEFNRILEN
ncbi:hypothetical protein FQA39_LY01048 [Lamprigera yunnana]|nr:hypothetical protein FQA39_LY01048 [Lamprigera yunnana]